ncbi:hypothetical protein EV361DRAFT_886373 [Lentinula raphanica]|nr:hypothetical protein EV361DRAFT_886373 [Lentinula raphanica]
MMQVFFLSTSSPWASSSLLQIQHMVEVFIAGFMDEFAEIIQCRMWVCPSLTWLYTPSENSNIASRQKALREMSRAECTQTLLRWSRIFTGNYQL